MTPKPLKMTPKPPKTPKNRLFLAWEQRNWGGPPPGPPPKSFERLFGNPENLQKMRRQDLEKNCVFCIS